MLKHSFFRRLAVGALLVKTVGSNAPAQACFTIAGNNTAGTSIPIQIADEQALIVWDAAHHREDFIRQATFQTKAQNIGFLVPTPTMPTLASADPAIFTQLKHLIRPMSLSIGGNTGFAPAKSAPDSSVQVLHTQQVAGYDAVVLEADNTKALTQWLKAHGYSSSPPDKAWLAPYVQAHWKITAFKIAKGDSRAATMTTSLVRMSFTTNQPFYPYREPAGSPVSASIPAPRLLRVFLLSNDWMRGRFQTPQPGKEWPGVRVGINSLSDFWRVLLARQAALKPNQLPKNLTLTTFEDHSSPRPALSDVIFQSPPPAHFRSAPSKAASDAAESRQPTGEAGTAESESRETR